MKEIYLDQGATSYPKAPGVSMAIADYIENIGEKEPVNSSPSKIQAMSSLPREPLLL